MPSDRSLSKKTGCKLIRVFLKYIVDFWWYFSQRLHLPTSIPLIHCSYFYYSLYLSVCPENSAGREGCFKRSHGIPAAIKHRSDQTFYHADYRGRILEKSLLEKLTKTFMAEKEFQWHDPQKREAHIMARKVVSWISESIYMNLHLTKLEERVKLGWKGQADSENRHMSAISCIFPIMLDWENKC